MAALVSQRNESDARVDLLTLKKAAWLAEQEGKHQIEGEHISRAWEETNALMSTSG